MLREANSEDGPLVSGCVVEVECPLLKEFTFLVENILFHFTVLFWEWIIPCWHEYISTLRSLDLHSLEIGHCVEIGCITCLLDVDSLWGLGGQVLFEVDTECLLNSLRLVREFEEYIAAVGHTLQRQRLWLGQCLINIILRQLSLSAVVRFHKLNEGN